MKTTIASLVVLSVGCATLSAAPVPSLAIMIAPVPDGGTTVALLGLSLVGLLAFRKKFRK